MYSDLHLHTRVSDGVMTPRSVVDKSKNLGLRMMSITDHDTVDGYDEAKKRADEVGIALISGVELSVQEETEMHILGYGMRIDEDFVQSVKYAGEMRKLRNSAILAKLDALGIHISEEELYNASGTKGRTHIARLMKQKGYVRSVNEAFDLYLGRGAKAYVPMHRLRANRAIDMILNAGGIPVLAHPLRFKVSGDLDRMIASLVDMGLKGIEVYYPTHTAMDVANFREIATRYDLPVTGGSDYHSDEYGSPIGAAKYLMGEREYSVFHHLIETNSSR